MASRGFFEVGIYQGKTQENIGTLWRSASQMGAAGIFTIGRRYKMQASDTVKAQRHIPLRDFDTVESFLAALPREALLVGVEMGGRPLPLFCHPKAAIYLLGSEDNGLPPTLLARCHHVVSIPSVRTESYNVSVAGSVVMYDRMVKGL